MNLTNAQLDTLKTWLSEGNPGAGLQDEEARAALNVLAAPAYYVWNSNVSAVSILDKVTFTNYTPNDAADNTNTWNNRAFNVQIKQQNLTLLFLNRSTFDATKVNLRSALNDATTNLPTGASGASRSGGWSNILPVLSRPATVAEKLFAVDDGAGIGNTTTDPRGANTNPDQCGTGADGNLLEGQITAANINDARNRP